MGDLVDRGVSYLVDAVAPESVRDDLRVIREELRCTAVMVIGSDTRRLLDAVGHALEAGLDVYVRPHPAGARPRQFVEHFREVAAGAERARRQHPDRVTLLLGSELSLTSRVAVPVGSEFLRLKAILRLRAVLRRRIDRRVNALLAELLSVARREFAGPVTYAAAYWERVDWSAMDVVGVNLYRMGDDPDAYARHVRSLVHTSAKPVVITEFGCGAHVGADRRGPGSFFIVNWFTVPPQVRPGHVRDESVQASYLTELIDLYTEAGVHGCFVFTFRMPDFPHDPDPRRDLDMAGFALVKPSSEAPEGWARKEAFAAVAERYSRPLAP
ncbi:hypothetical protein [Phytohabitans kaempferiae]|uniref:Abortive infection protein n=1 Tax=Phytohabitans kaempferiae TaxID=1620943 RepID=A0ABV6MIE3_9ACTN